MTTSRNATVTRKTTETDIHLQLGVDGQGRSDIDTGIAFFDHMLTLFSVHGRFDLNIKAEGDIDVDYHHTVEDIGLVLGDALDKALGDRTGIQRYGHSVIPMDEVLAAVTVDLSRRPYWVCNFSPPEDPGASPFNIYLAKEFLRAFATRGGLNLHVNVFYGENQHHIIEAVFKALARALSQAVSFDRRMKGVPSSKGIL